MSDILHGTAVKETPQLTPPRDRGDARRQPEDESGVAPAASDAKLRLVSDLYQVRDADATIAFFKECPSLLDELINVSPTIQQYFGPGAQQSVEFISHEEAPEDARLQVLVRCNLAPAEAVRRTEDFYRAAWFEVLPRSQWKMTFGVE